MEPIGASNGRFRRREWVLFAACGAALGVLLVAAVLAFRSERRLLEESGLSARVYGEHVFYEGAGCMECNGTGFLGRLAVSELLDLSDRIRELILDRRPGSEIRRAAKEEGMRFLRESALEKALGGWTTLREINRFTFVD